MSEAVKRYITCVEIPADIPDVVVCARDYETLEAKFRRLSESLKDADSGMALFLEQRNELAAELASLGAQEPVIDAPYGGILRIEAGGLPDSWVRINPCKLYTAPPPQPSTAALCEALEACLEIEERPEVLEAARKALAEHREGKA